MSEKEINDLIVFLEEMVSKYPNDQELGKEVRKYFLLKTQQIKPD